MLRRILLFAFVVLSASPAMAWWDAGHKVIAAIAFRQLSAEEQRCTFELLKAHPRWREDFVEWMPEQVATGDIREQAEWSFMQAAVWPDIVRDFEGDDKTTYHHATWHYVNIPLFLSDADRMALSGKLTVNVSTQPPDVPIEAMNIIQTMQVARKLIADPATPPATKAVMLTWLFHLVGDSHQPMHSTACFSQRLFPEGCRGGNSIKTRQRENLHSLWDSLLGEKLGYRQARNEALKLMSDAELQAAGERAVKSLDPVEWIRESRELAEAVAAGPEVLTPLRAADRAGEKIPTIALTEDYLSHAGQIAKRRAVESGYRLGAVLKEVVATGK
ncbi:MAG TPA: S1/P1 nuclease [Planctomycetaceae bacterium]|nr:S1/P1 nuclease [Planctomycetaceae bacterium]